MRKNAFLIVLLVILFILSAVVLSAKSQMMAIMSFNGSYLSQNDDTHIYGDFTLPCLDKLRIMGDNLNSSSTSPYNNPNGWGLIDYISDKQTVEHIWRNHQTEYPYFDNAFSSQGFTDAVGEIQCNQSRIVMGHVRYDDPATVTARIPDPHPFIFRYNGKDYSFIHCGQVDWVDLYSRIGVDWFNQHPEYQVHWYPTENPITCVDSEIYFCWIMKNIEEQNGDVLKALKIAIHALTSSTSYGNLNFILSDGTDLYGYRNRIDDSAGSLKSLAYFHDIVNVKKNHFYGGFMSIFPDQWLNEGGAGLNVDVPDGVVTHMLDKDELVYISSTGNIVRLPNFGTTQYAEAKYFQKRDFHKGYNWTGFPILPIVQGNSSLSLSDFYMFMTYFMYPENGMIKSVRFKNDVTNQDQFQWNPSNYQLSMANCYKIDFDADSPPIHTYTPSLAYPWSPVVRDAFLYPSNMNILENIVADNEYWISYTLLPTQGIKDAFGSSWNNVKSVKAENFYYQQLYSSQSKSGGPTGDLPLETYSPAGKNLEFGKGYIVTFVNNQESFAWSQPYLRELPGPVSQKPEFFTWKDAPEYMVIDIAQAENEPTILEVGAFQGDKCIGAVKPKKIPCQLLVYPLIENPNPVTFQIIYKGKDTPQVCSEYQVYHPELSGYYTDQILPAKEGLYQVKLSGSTPSQNASSIAPLVSLSNYPNPFNPNTTISFALNQKSDISIEIYNVKGQIVRDFGKQTYESGIHRLKWDGRNNENAATTDGIYFVKVASDKNILTQKMVMLK